jgi:mannose-6-phosphate isomerase
MKPIALTPNQPAQFYRGGRVIGSFRGVAAADERRPEDWVGSTTARNGASGGEGLTTLPDGRLLRDAVLEDPEGWLGPAHAAALGANPALLVKLLDAGERLPVHVHPTRSFAQRHLGCSYGKTEAWVVLAAEGPDARVHLGFSRDIEAGELDRWMAVRDTRAILASLHAVNVKTGDTVLVPAGLPHAIGAGIFCLELQEPTDFSLMLEWEGFEFDPREARLGLDAELAQACVQRHALTPQRLAGLRSHGGRTRSPADLVEQLFPEDADPFFRAERIRPGGGHVELAPGFAILVVFEGDGELRTSGAGAMELRAGSATVIPYGAGETTLSGSLVAVRCRPPSVEAALAGGLEAPVSEHTGEGSDDE